MAVHRVTKILPYAPDQLAALVADVRAYPEFVPWVSSMRAWGEREEVPGVTVIDAEAAVGFSLLTERFSTWVRHDRNAPKVEVGLIRGPFHHLKNRWEFFPHPEGTRVEFFIDFAFTLCGPAQDAISGCICARRAMAKASPAASSSLPCLNSASARSR